MMRREPAFARYLAKRRLLDPSPAAVELLENSIGAAVDDSLFREAKRLLAYRLMLSERLNDSRADKELLAGLSIDLDWAIANPQKATAPAVRSTKSATVNRARGLSASSRGRGVQ